MEYELWVLAALCLVFFAAGFIDSISGGGGLIGLPAFILAGFPADIAIATNKFASCCGMTVAFTNYARSGLVNWRAALVGLPAAFLGGIIGSKAMLAVDNAFLGKIVLVLLPLGMFATLMPKKDKGAKVITRFGLYVVLPLFCFALGFYDGFFGPGSGSFFIIGLHIILGYGLLESSATSKVFNLACGLSAIVIYMWYGKVLYAVGLPLAAANMLGGYTGSKMAIRIGAEFVRRLLFISLMLLFCSLVWKFLFA